MNLINTLLSLALLPPLLFLFWTLSVTGSSSPFTRDFPTVRNKRICLLIAHPDDEAMFFAPTLLELTKPELGNHVKILCLSSGDADGLGHIRKKELQKSALQLGLRDESDVFVVDDPSRFPDSMTTTWSATRISSLLASAFAPELSSPPRSSPPPNTTQRRKSSASTSKETNTNNNTNGTMYLDDTSASSSAVIDSDQPNATIDILLTFDETGVSNHPNHRSLYHGARTFLESLMRGKSSYTCPVTLYTLTSTTMLRKYIGVLDAPLSMFYSGLGNTFFSANNDNNNNNNGIIGSGDNFDQKVGRELQPAADRLLFVSSVGDWLSGWKAMVHSHKSQMVWFRWGWITLGRYMVVNDLVREQVS